MSLTFTETLILQQIGMGQTSGDLDVRLIVNNIRDKCHNADIADASDEMRFATMNVKLWEWYKCATMGDRGGQEVKFAAIVYHVLQMCAARNNFDIGGAVVRSLSDNDYVAFGETLEDDPAAVAMSISSGLGDCYDAKTRQWGLARVIHRVLAYGYSLGLDVPSALASKCDNS